MNVQNAINTDWTGEYVDAAIMSNTMQIRSHITQLCAPNVSNMMTAIAIALLLAFDFFYKKSTKSVNI